MNKKTFNRHCFFFFCLHETPISTSWRNTTLYWIFICIQRVTRDGSWCWVMRKPLEPKMSWETDTLWCLKLLQSNWHHLEQLKLLFRDFIYFRWAEELCSDKNTPEQLLKLWILTGINWRSNEIFQSLWNTPVQQLKHLRVENDTLQSSY